MKSFAVLLAGATSGNGPDIMNEVRRNILDCIGNTSLLALRNVVPANGSRILLKLESENPTGSMKDRMALAMIEAAEANGRLKTGGSVVEYTGGSTGVSLSLICAVKGYPLHIVTSDAFAWEKLDHMKNLGARLTIVRSDSGRMTEKLTRDMIEAARIIRAETGGFWTDQLNNTDQLVAYHKMAEEIWSQTEGEVAAFVHCVGTAASSRGVATVLKRYQPAVEIVVVEPAESAVLSGGSPGPHKIWVLLTGHRGVHPPIWRRAGEPFGKRDRLFLVSTAPEFATLADVLLVHRVQWRELSQVTEPVIIKVPHGMQ